MSLKLTELLAPDGSKIYLQYDEDESDDLRAVGYIDDIAQRTERFTSSLSSTVRGYAQIVLNTVQQGMTDLRAPQKVTLEFGIQAGGETGVPFITKGTAQANVKVMIEWNLSNNE